MSTAPATNILHSASPGPIVLTSANVAKIIFGPELYSLYTQWQRNFDSIAEARQYASQEQWKSVRNTIQQGPIGELPSTLIYRTFMGRHKKELYIRAVASLSTNTIEQDELGNGLGNGHGGDGDGDGDGDTHTHTEKKGAGLPPTRATVTASLCNHTLHPSFPHPAVDVCPVCLIRVSTAALARIAQAWQQVGGPDQKPASEAQWGFYARVKRLWYLEKVRWANMMHCLGVYATLEAGWEEKRRAEVGRGGEVNVPEGVRGCSRCADAVALAGRCAWVGSGWGDQFVGRKKKGRVRMHMDKGKGKGDGDDNVSGREAAAGKDCYAALSLPHSPPYSPKVEPDLELDKSLRCDGVALGASSRAARQHELTVSQRMNIIRQQLVTQQRFNTRTIRPPSPSPSVFPPTPKPPSLSLSTRSTTRITFPPTTKDTPSRHRRAFHRRSPFYEKGQHACAPGQEWQDTSFMGDEMYDVFPNDDDDDEDAPVTDFLVNISGQRVYTNPRPVFRVVPRQQCGWKRLPGTGVTVEFEDCAEDGEEEGLRVAAEDSMLDFDLDLDIDSQMNDIQRGNFGLKRLPGTGVAVEFEDRAEEEEEEDGDGVHDDTTLDIPRAHVGLKRLPGTAIAVEYEASFEDEDELNGLAEDTMLDMDSQTNDIPRAHHGSKRLPGTSIPVEWEDSLDDEDEVAEHTKTSPQLARASKRLPGTQIVAEFREEASLLDDEDLVENTTTTPLPAHIKFTPLLLQQQKKRSHDEFSEEGVVDEVVIQQAKRRCA
ncbi:hypothetical protein BDW02DRAFT_594360 [Decorospora gaudefroyi]|uniref:Uncharacterized protein n=1 Tax=Decorospora gaudefroyi TaxID=184978 RepID=A0A6A5KV03_9PLEO|nr:hypothetical protein BDW02DRAFT_594360 [Decorospora gaudefroyi]